MYIFYLFFILVIILVFWTPNQPENFATRKEEEYVKLLDKTAKALRSIDVPFFLSSGTCLGYFRENKILDHDYDIDIGVMRRDFKPEILQAMYQQGFKLKNAIGDLESGLEYQFLYPNNPLGRRARVDIFVHYDELVNDENHIYWVSANLRENPPKKIKYRVKNFGIKNVKFYDIDVGIPEDTEKYLEQHYGLDWRIPRIPGKQYFFASSPVSIVKDFI